MNEIMRAAYGQLLHNDNAPEIRKELAGDDRFRIEEYDNEHFPHLFLAEEENADTSTQTIEIITQPAKKPRINWSLIIALGIFMVSLLGFIFYMVDRG